MEYYIKSVIPVIESNYGNFTPVERSIADFFIRNQENVELSSRAMAERLYVSEASLSRFAKKCGYRGYREFVYQYEETFVEKNLSMTGQTRMALNVYQELLDKTYSLINESQILRICRYLRQAGRVFVCGVGSSGLAAREMEMRFLRTGVNIYSIQDSDLIRMRAVFQDHTSLIIGISISGSAKDILYLLRESHKKGAKTMLVTARNRGDHEEFCDELLLIPSLRYMDHGNVISPQFPILVMLDVLYSYYVEQDEGERARWHEGVIKELKEKRQGKDPAVSE